MYLYICGSVGGRSGSLVPFGAGLWEAVTLCRRRGTRSKSLMCPTYRPPDRILEPEYERMCDSCVIRITEPTSRAGLP